MKILGISGSPTRRGTYYLLEQALNKASSEGAETELIQVTDYDLKQCIGCDNCLKNQECSLDDDLEEVMGKMLVAEGIIIGAPSYFGSVPGCLKNLMDRSRYLKMKNHSLKNKFLGVISSSGLRHGGAQSTIETIYRFGLLHGMLIVGPTGHPQAESNMVVGTIEQDEGWGKVKEDKKAERLAKKLGKRLANLKEELCE